MRIFYYIYCSIRRVSEERPEVNCKLHVYMRLLLTLILTLTCLASRAQQPTEEEYRSRDDALWQTFSAQTDSLMRLIQAAEQPAIRDSLTSIYRALYDDVLQRNWQLALRYATVPGGLQRCFMVRAYIPDDSLRAALGRLPASLRRNRYAEAIRLHLRCRKIEPGGRIRDFTFRTPQGNRVRLSDYKGRQLLLLYGGLDCMGESGRKWLDKLYARTSREALEIVVYWPVESIGELQRTAAAYPMPFAQVSDMKGDVTPFKIYYQAQATPTCFFIGRDGKLLHKSEGLDPDRFEKLIEEGR